MNAVYSHKVSRIIMEFGENMPFDNSTGGVDGGADPLCGEVCSEIYDFIKIRVFGEGRIDILHLL